MSVVATPIGSVCVGIFDGPHATPKLEESGKAIFLGIREITANGRLDLTAARWVVESDYEKWTRRVIPQKGDIVFTYEATLHRYARIPEGLQCCLGRRTALIRPDPQKVNPDYLFQHLLSPAWRAVIEANIITGATVDRIPLSKFPEFEVLLPPRSEQDEIASVLTAYDKLIYNLDAQREKLSKAKALMLPLLMGDMPQNN